MWNHNSQNYDNTCNCHCTDSWASMFNATYPWKWFQSDDIDFDYGEEKLYLLMYFQQIYIGNQSKIIIMNLKSNELLIYI